MSHMVSSGLRESARKFQDHLLGRKVAARFVEAAAKYKPSLAAARAAEYLAEQLARNPMSSPARTAELVEEEAEFNSKASRGKPWTLEMVSGFISLVADNMAKLKADSAHVHAVKEKAAEYARGSKLEKAPKDWPDWLKADR